LQRTNTKRYRCNITVLGRVSANSAKGRATPSLVTSLSTDGHGAAFVTDPPVKSNTDV
jgi:hypothetical protein